MCFGINNIEMPNINYSLGKDFLIFNSLPSSVTYYLQSWSGLGFETGDTTTATPFGTSYNPGDVLTYNTFSGTFIIDENWEVFENLQNMCISNAPIDSASYNPIITDIDLHLLNNTTKKEVGIIRMYDGYINSIVNVDNAYNTSDNTVTKTITAIIKYQYHKFLRNTDETVI